ncbi:MAG TPA: NAD-dependent epimerase/dehydratase family protein [Anaerolineae bacterium]|nr:NAD-dependent epimerase/dehydratase family protein [Anaerolineae bacterium]
MKVLVTGGAGFIGSHVAERLLQRGDAVVALDNFNDYYSPARKRANAAILATYPNARLVEADIRDAAAIDALFASEKFDRVVHLAAMGNVRYSIQHPSLYVDVNINGTQRLLEAARRHGTPHFVLASTSSVYGQTDKLPFVETDPTDHPLAPYPATKKACEVMAYTYHVAYGLKCRVLRFFNVYGPRGRPDMMPYVFAERISRGQAITLFDTGHPQRDWTYIDDTVDGVTAALDADFDYEIFNLGRGQPVVMSEFLHVIEELTGRTAIIRPAPLPATEPTITFSDTSKAGRMLNYHPSVSLVDGLARFWEWYKTNAER